MEIEFEIVGESARLRLSPSDDGIRILAKLNRLYGIGNWRKLKGLATVRLPDGRLLKPRFTGSRPRYRKTSNQDQTPYRLKTMAEQKQFAVCIRNEEYEASLELRKIYEVLEDADATKHQMIRVVDEEGEDCLYPSSWFVAIELPRNVEQAISRIGRALELPPNAAERQNVGRTTAAKLIARICGFADHEISLGGRRF